VCAMMNFFGGRNSYYSAEIFFLFGDSSFCCKRSKRKNIEEAKRNYLKTKKEEFMHEKKRQKMQLETKEMKMCRNKYITNK
jgi:hypothetical protein